MITPSFGLTATERVLPSMALDFTTAVLDPRITFTRSGNTATVIDSTGVIVAVNADIPRFDYNPSTLVCNGLLIEESRTNQTLQSEDFSTSWTLNAVSASVDVTTSPDGTTNADKVYAQATTAQHYAAQSYSATLSNSYTLSVFAKAAEETSITLRHIGATTFASAVYDLSDGTVSTVSGTASIKYFGNGWYRCVLTGVADSTTPTYRINLRQASSYTGDGTSGAYVWGAQLEAGAFPTSYIPTVASQVTRTADVATMTGTNFSSWYNANEGAFVVQVNMAEASVGSTSFAAFDASVGATSDRVLMYAQRSGLGPYMYINNSAASNFNFDVGTTLQGKNIIAYSYNSSGCAASDNGTSPITRANDSAPSGIDQILLGDNLASTAALNNHLQKLMYFPQRLTNAEVQAFSK